MAILVLGGAGYIGSHTALELVKAGNEVVIADNLVNRNFAAMKATSVILTSSTSFFSRRKSTL